MLLDRPDISKNEIRDCSFAYRPHDKTKLELSEHSASHDACNCNIRWHDHGIPSVVHGWFEDENCPKSPLAFGWALSWRAKETSDSH